MTASHSDLVGSGAPRDPAGAWAKPALRHMLAETDRFITLVELVPSRGLVTDEAGRRVLALGRALAENSARFFHTGKVPGVVVTDELLALAERQDASPDRGRSFFHELAAKQIVIARGLGFRGAYIGGHLTATDYDEILERADAYGADDWSSLIRDVRFPQADEFHYFEEDAETGRSSVEVNREYAQSRARASGRRPIRGSLAYSFNRFMHGAMFEPSGRLHRIVRAVYHDCGDCSLPEIAYLCPESSCVKNQRNGPCGGTRDSICEIGEKECIWARAYERLKAYGQEETMLDGPAVIQDNALRGTSAWSNSLLERDHRAKRAVPPEAAQEEDVA